MKNLMSLEERIDIFGKVCSGMSNTDLANEYLAYKKAADKAEPEYKIVLSEIEKRIDSKFNGSVSVDLWAKKYKMTDTDEKALAFYNILNNRGLSPESAKVDYLRIAIVDAYEYSALNKKKEKREKEKSKNIQNEIYSFISYDFNLEDLKFYLYSFRKSDKTENIWECSPEKIRSFSIKGYYQGESVHNRICGKI